MHDEVRVTKDEWKKPDIHKLYDHTKGDVDVVDLISTSCTTRIKNERWPLNAFAFILDTDQTNAKTIHQDSTGKLKTSNFEFTYALGILLVLPEIERTYANPKGHQIDLMQCIWRILGIPELNRCVVTSTPAKTGWCYACVEDLVGTNVYKERREKLNTRVKTNCSICNALICKQHTQLACEKCNNCWRYFFKKPIKSLINSKMIKLMCRWENIFWDNLFLFTICLLQILFRNTLRCKKVCFFSLLLKKCWHHQIADVSKKLYFHKFGITSHKHVLEQSLSCIK